MTEFLLNCALLLAAPLVFSGFVRFVQTRCAERPLALFRQFLGLLNEGVKPGDDSHFIYETASSLMLASIFMAGVLVPMVGHRAVVSFDNAGILFFSFLLLEKAVRTFGHRSPVPAAKARESGAVIFRKVLPEFTLYVLLIAASWTSGALSFEKLFGISAGLSGNLLESVLRMLYPLALGAILLRDERHGADGYRGSDRAVVIFGLSLREFLIAALIAGFAIPYVNRLNVFLYLILFLVILAVIAVITGTLRSVLRRPGYEKLPDVLLTASVSAIILLSILSPLF